MRSDIKRKLRLSLPDNLWERLCTQAYRLGIEPEQLAETLLTRAIRRLPASSERAA